MDQKWKSRSEKKKKQEWAIEKPKLDNARRLKGIYSIDPDDEESKDIIKKCREKLEKHMDAAMPCKNMLSKSTSQETGQGTQSLLGHNW